MGRVLFTPKSEPAVDWSEIEISPPGNFCRCPTDRSSGRPFGDAGKRPGHSDDPTLTNDPPVTSDPPVINPGDLLAEMLSLLGEGAVSRSPRQDIAEFPMVIEASASVPSQSATAFNRVRAGSN